MSIANLTSFSGLNVKRTTGYTALDGPILDAATPITGTTIYTHNGFQITGPCPTGRESTSHA